MLVDIIGIVFVIAFIVLGARRGLIEQVFGFLALVAAALFAVPAGVALTGPFARAFQMEPYGETQLKIYLSLACVVIIFLLVKFLGGWVNHWLGRREAAEGEEAAPTGERPLRGWNRSWGALLGAGKGVIAYWLIISFFGAFPNFVPAAHDAVMDSRAGGAVRAWNVFEQIAPPEIERAVLALWELNRNHPRAFEQVMQQQSIREVREHRALRELLDEGRGDVIGALRDRDFRETLARIDWGEVARTAEQALEQARREDDPEPIFYEEGEPEPAD